MNMKKFVKKLLVIVVLMLVSGGMVNMVYVELIVINSKDIFVIKIVKEGGLFLVEFKVIENEIVLGKLDVDIFVFYLVMLDLGEYKGWNVWFIGVFEGG